MTKCPGVMLYFDSVRPALNRLDDEKCGQLFRAIIDYAEYGVMPELDQLVGMVFDLLVPKINRDAEKYEESREQRQFAVYCRKKQKAGEMPMKFAEWRLARSKPLESENIGPMSPDIEKNGSYPSISISPSISPSIKSSVATTREGSGKGEVEGYKGGGGGEPTPEILQAAWKEAKEAGDNTEALRLANALYRKGYIIDFFSGELAQKH